MLVAGSFALAAALLFVGLGRRAFFDNEGRYAERAREMVLFGDYIIPHLNFAVFLNEPPLLAWLTAVYFRVFGLGEGARVWSGLAGLLTLAVVWDLGRSPWDFPAGWVAALAFAARWRSGGPLVLVSDPLRRRESPRGLAPGARRVLGRFGDRWLVANVRAVG